MFKPEDFEKFKEAMSSRPPSARIEQDRDRARRFHEDRQALLDVGTGQVHPLRAQAFSGLSMLSEQAWNLVAHCVDDPAIPTQLVRQANPPPRQVRQDVADGLGQLLAQRRATTMAQALPSVQEARRPRP